jgi:uncharacterized OsmC-like protein
MIDPYRAGPNGISPAALLLAVVLSCIGIAAASFLFAKAVAWLAGGM